MQAMAVMEPIHTQEARGPSAAAIGGVTSGHVVMYEYITTRRSLRLKPLPRRVEVSGRAVVGQEASLKT